MLEFLKYSEQNKRSYEDDVSRARTLARHFAGHEINGLGAADVYAFIQHRQEVVTNGTINRELALMSAAINHCNKNLDWQLPNKFAGRSLKEKEGIVRWITKEEANKLIEVAKESVKAPYLADFITIALHTGCRSGELFSMTWAQVDLKQNLLLLERTKTNKRRGVPINNAARKAFLSRLNWRAKHCPAATHVFCGLDCKGVGCIKRSFKTAKKKAGIANFRIHDMRHTCAAWLVMRGVPLIVVRDLLGHKSIKTTEIYAHLAPDNIRAGVAMLD